MLKMMEKKSNDKGELIDRTAWFTRLLELQKQPYSIFRPEKVLI